MDKKSSSEVSSADALDNTNKFGACDCVELVELYKSSVQCGHSALSRVIQSCVLLHHSVSHELLDSHNKVSHHSTPVSSPHGSTNYSHPQDWWIFERNSGISSGQEMFEQKFLQTQSSEELVTTLHLRDRSPL